jgi:hypothetical protein
MVAAICGWHEHNERAARGLETRLDRGETMLIAAPALVETYAVLTRLPPPPPSRARRCPFACQGEFHRGCRNHYARCGGLSSSAARCAGRRHRRPSHLRSRHRRMCDPGESHGAADVQRQGFRPVRAGRDDRGHAGIEPVQLLLRADPGRPCMRWGVAELGRKEKGSGRFGLVSAGKDLYSCLSS